jgi:hypothetical protein
MTKRYSSVLPPCLAMSSPAAFADPPDRWCSVDVTSAVHVRTCRNQIVDNDHILSWLDRVLLHLENILHFM